MSYSELITVTEASKIMNVSRATAYRLANHREIPVVMLGGCVRIHRRKLIELLENKVEMKV